LTSLPSSDWSISFTFPNSLTQVLRFIGPIKLSRYANGVHMASVKSDTQAGSSNPLVKASFIGVSPTRPTQWQDMMIKNVILQTGPANSQESTKLNVASDYFLPKQTDDIPREPVGIYTAQTLSSEEEAVKKNLDSLSNADSTDTSDQAKIIRSDGTYLVGTQTSLIIYIIVFGFGSLSYIVGSIIRLKHRKQFRIEKIKRARTVAGYSRIL